MRNTRQFQKSDMFRSTLFHIYFKFYSLCFRVALNILNAHTMYVHTTHNLVSHKVDVEQRGSEKNHVALLKYPSAWRPYRCVIVRMFESSLLQHAENIFSCSQIVCFYQWDCNIRLLSLMYFLTIQHKQFEAR